jgi:hypothetical protein
MLRAPSFSDRTWDFLAEDLSAVDWLLKAEALDKDLKSTERELREARVSRPVSNQQLLDALEEVIQEGLPIRDDRQRQATLREMVAVVERALSLDYAAKKFKLAKAAPALQEAYLCVNKVFLEVDFESLGRVDKSAEADKRIAELESKLTKIQRQFQGHRGCVLRCFRNGALPTAFGESLRDAGTALNAGRPHEDIAEMVLRRFATDWRQRAPLFEKPVSVHGTLIESMRSDRREVWQQAYDKLKLGELPKFVHYAPRLEQRSAPASMPQGTYFNTGREAVSSR